MSLTKQNSKKEVKHEHFFGETTNRCACGAYRISRAEYAHRCEVWNRHFEDCKNTVSYESFRYCLDLWKEYVAVSKIQARNQYDDFQSPKAKELLEEIRQLGKDARDRLAKGDYLPKPPFPEPYIGANWSSDGEWAIYQAKPIL